MELLGYGQADDKDQARGEDTNRFLERGIIPLPLLDDVMGFNADEALRTRQQLQQQEEVGDFTFFALEWDVPRRLGLSQFHHALA